MTRLLSALALAAVLVATTPVRANDYHISPQGDDEADGSVAAPWRTIEQVNRHGFRPGDRIWFEGGETFDGNLTLAAPETSSDPQNPITIGSYGEGRAVIQAGGGTGVQVEDLGGVVIRDLVVIGAPREENQGFGILVVHRKSSEERLEGVRIEGVEARGFRWVGIYVGGVPTMLPAFRTRDASRVGFQDVRIENCKARENTYYGILVDGASKTADTTDYANKDVSIVNCVAADNPGDPEYMANHSGNGILLGDTDGGLIERCVAYRNGEQNAGKTGGPVGIWAYASNRVTIQFCEAYDNRTGGRADGGGFDFDGGVTNSVIQYCYSHDNDGPGFLVWNYKGAPHQLANIVIRYNISAGDGRKHRYGGISVGTSEAPLGRLLVHNNTIYTRNVPGGEQQGVRVWEQSGSDIWFVNNLFITEGGVPAVVYEAPDPDDIRFLGNAYWATDGAFEIRDRDQRFDSLKAWRAATGQERFKNQKVGLYVDPQLNRMAVDVTIGAGGSLSDLEVFRLQPNSPLIDAGLDLDQLWNQGPGPRDFWGTALPNGPALDIGADEFEPSS